MKKRPRMLPRAHESKPNDLIASNPSDCLIEKCLTKNVSDEGIRLMTEALRFQCPLDARYLKVVHARNAAQHECREAAARYLTMLGQVEGGEMSDCIHCQIHDLLEGHLQNQEVNLADIAFKVTEVIADLILMAPPEDQGMMIADILRNLGQFVLDKNGEAEDEGQSGPRRH